LAADFMKDYVFLAVGRVGAASKDVTQRVEWIEQHEKVDFLLDFLSRAPKGLTLVFVETKRGADFLEERLCRENYPACSIHGDKSQREREDALKSFKTGRTPILVATDVAARGLDIPNVTQVINFDLPSNVDDYVHRIGRTGRVGNVGNALSLMNEKNRGLAKELGNLLIENEQECPPWLAHMVAAGGGNLGRGRAKGRGGGNRFGARDIRRDNNNRQDNSSMGGSGGGPPMMNRWTGPKSGGGAMGGGRGGIAPLGRGSSVSWTPATPLVAPPAMNYYAAPAPRNTDQPPRNGDNSAW